MNIDQKKSFEKMAHAIQSWVSYQSLPDEIDPHDIPFLGYIFDQCRVYKVPKDTKEDPFAYAGYITHEISSLACGILIPGSRFDSFGTRYGRGRGWFDRFLSAIPYEWTRIGVTDSSRLSTQMLSRQPWDEPVDWIIVRDDSKWRVLQTSARVTTSQTFGG